MNINKFLTILMSLAFLLLQSTESLAKLNIVTTTEDIASIAKEIAGDLADVKSIARGNQDAHYIQAKPSYMVKLNRADLLIYQGLELEAGWLPLLIQGARNPKILPNAPGHLDLSSVIKPIDVPKGEVDRSMGDIHPLGNPHYPLDPQNGFLMAMAIADVLGKLDAKNENVYQGNMIEFNTRLREKIGEWNSRLGKFRAKKVVTYHTTWGYFLKHFGIGQTGVVEIVPGIPPSPKHLVELAKSMKKENTRLILQANYYEPKFSELLAEKSGGTVLILPASVGGSAEAKDYLDLFETLVSELETALEN